MKFYWLTLGMLTVWRITHLLQAVHGEFAVAAPRGSDRPLLALFLLMGKVIKMKVWLWLILRPLAGLIAFLESAGTRAVVAENLLLKQQLLAVSTRTNQARELARFHVPGKLPEPRLTRRFF